MCTFNNKLFFSQVCRVENCYLTTNKSLLKDLSEFDALLFHMSGIRQVTIDNLHNVVIWIFKTQNSIDFGPKCRGFKKCQNKTFKINFLFQETSDGF